MLLMLSKRVRTITDDGGGLRVGIVCKEEASTMEFHKGRGMRSVQLALGVGLGKNRVAVKPFLEEANLSEHGPIFKHASSPTVTKRSKRESSYPTPP